MPNGSINDLDLNRLGAGTIGLTEACGKVMAECAAVCLTDRRHCCGTNIQVAGDYQAQYNLVWPQVTDQMQRCHNDKEVATEHGAYGIAILLIQDLTGLSCLEKSRKGTGFDYWLGNDPNDLFQNKARLEVSGILDGDARDIENRIRVKCKQTDRSAGYGLPAYIAVIEFGRPCAKVVNR